MGKITKATDQEGVAEYREQIQVLREAHEAELQRSHQVLVKQLAEIEALEHMMSVEKRVAATAAAVPLMKRGRPLPRPGGLGPRGRSGVGRPIESKHPFPNAVGNVLAWSEANGLSYTHVKSWYAKNRPKAIQRRWATLLEKTYGIPVSAWRGGVSDHPSRK